MMNKKEQAIWATRTWVEQVVVAYQLCPFARLPFQQNTIRYTCTAASDLSSLKKVLLRECSLLKNQSVKEISTTLLILAEMGKDFMDYWNIVGFAEEWLQEAEYSGVFQLASFHPDYIFAGVDPQAAQNYTNRSPWPLLHLLREEELGHAIDSHSNIQGIPQRNIELMEAKGKAYWQNLLKKISEIPQKNK